MNSESFPVPVRPARRFLPLDLQITSWNLLEPYFKELFNSEISDIKQLKQWLLDKSELGAVLEEDLAWRYIKMNINTRDESAAKQFHFFIEEIEPKIAPYQNKFDLKLQALNLPEISNDVALNIVLQKAGNHVRTFREINIPIQTQIQSKSQDYGLISSEMSVMWEGKSLTLPQASVILKDTNRSAREKIYKLIQTRRLIDKDKLNELFDKLLELRNKLAQNSGFENYRDYKFVDLCRFDYTKEDCYNFHDAISKEAVPLIECYDEQRKIKLKLNELKPWDTQVDTSGKQALKPFVNADDLVSKTIECFNRVDPYFGRCIEIMSEMGHLDLDSKEGKAPGGFNYPLYEIGVPFIFMNSAGTIRDMVTMMHEGGHAIHSFLSRDLEIIEYKDLTSEVAELASMSMELISMEHWNVFFEKEEDLKRAKREQLEQTIDTLPWVAQIDKFQHWIYENPGHNVKEREEVWVRLMAEFGSSAVDWNGLENERRYLWQKQLHLFEVPFYYIEYGMAQLGAIAVWKNYKSNPKKTIEQYKKALSLGYTKSIGEIYETAGISFNFSREYVRELMQFVKSEIELLN